MESIVARDRDAGSQVESLLTVVMKQLRDAKTAAGGEGDEEPRFFFPNGIELIEISFDLGANIKLSLTISGPLKRSAEVSS